jgi:hypothetical protein
VQRVVGQVGLLKGCAMNEGDFELYGGTLGACNVFWRERGLALLRLMRSMLTLFVMMAVHRRRWKRRFTCT